MSEEIRLWSYENIMRLIQWSERGPDFWIRPSVPLDDAKVYVDCSDLFYWGTSDTELFTPDDIPAMQQCLDDLAALKGDTGPWYAGALWCARKRGMRPQGPWYGYCDQNGMVRHRFVAQCVKELFDACGPERVDSPQPPRPADGRRWDYGGAKTPADNPPEFVAKFQPGGEFGP